jgi:hypothetical protein
VGGTCSLLVQAYVDAWVTEIHVYNGYIAGVYANPGPINSDISQVSPKPDAIWITKTPLAGNPPQVTIWNLGISDSLWPNQQRMHQFLMNQSATFGGVGPVNIDPDIDSGPVLNANKGAKTYSSYTLTSYIYPGATATWMYAINDIWNVSLINGPSQVGQIVGAYCCTGPAQAWHGFLFDGLVAWSPIQYPGEVSGGATGINNAGQIVGNWVDSSHCPHGYLFSGGAYTSIDNPNAVCANGGTGLWGINDAGQISGLYYGATGFAQNFLYYKGKYYTVSYPGESFTTVYGINGDGMITGMFSGPAPQTGFVESPIPPTWAGTFSSFFDAAGIATFGQGVNNNGDVAGYYEISYLNDVALLYSNNFVFYSFQCAPPYADTYASDVNDFGQAVGRCGGTDFVYVPQP